MAVYVGIDVHKKFCQAALMNDHGHILRELRFDNTLEGTSSLVNLARSIDPHIKAVVEPSANYWIRIYDKLEDEGVEVKLSNPLRTKAIAEARVKMDKLDAKTLAYLLRGDLVGESYVPTRKNRDRRALIRHRANLMRMRVEVKNRIHALLDKHELSYEYTDLFGKQGLEWLNTLQLSPSDKLMLNNHLDHLSHDDRMRVFYERVKHRRGDQKAIIAVANKMLKTIWFMVTRREPYQSRNEKRYQQLNSITD